MILVHPFAQKLRNGNINPKNYPWWSELVPLLQRIDYDVQQLGVEGESQLCPVFLKNLPIKAIREKIRECKFWISVDSFLPHLAQFEEKNGVVIFSQSNPDHYGYSNNLNILKSPQYLRHDQFGTWEEANYNEHAFFTPDIVFNLIKDWIPQG